MPNPSDNLERQIERRLAEQQVRLTSGRRVVIAALAAGDGPRSVAEIHRRIRRRVPLSSLYRTLAVLEAAGVIALHHSSKGITRYELADWLRGHHHHLLCIECGGVDDIEIPPSLEKDLRHIVSRVGVGANFHPTDHALEIAGLCAKCT